MVIKTRYYAQWLDLIGKARERLTAVPDHMHTPTQNRWFMLVMSRLDRPGSLLELGSLFEVPPENLNLFGLYQMEGMQVCHNCRENLETWMSTKMQKEIAGMRRLGSFL
jgi:hypothetical protein